MAVNSYCFIQIGLSAASFFCLRIRSGTIGTKKSGRQSETLLNTNHGREKRKIPLRWQLKFFPSSCLEHCQVPIRFLRQVRDLFKYYRQGNKQTQISKSRPRANKNATFPLQAVPVALCKAINYILSQLGIKSIKLPWLDEKQPLIFFRSDVFIAWVQKFHYFISTELTPEWRENELQPLFQHARSRTSYWGLNNVELSLHI